MAAVTYKMAKLAYNRQKLLTNGSIYSWQMAALFLEYDMPETWHTLKRSAT
jgi:hypothetical protein